MLYVPSCLNLQRLAQDCRRAGWRDPAFLLNKSCCVSLHQHCCSPGTAALLPASCQSRTGLAPRVGVGVDGHGHSRHALGSGWWWYSPLTATLKVGILMTQAQTACPHVATQSWPCCPVEWARDTRGDAWPRRWANPLAITPYSLCQSGSRWRTDVWSCRSARRQACSSGSVRAAPWCPGTTPGVPRQLARMVVGLVQGMLGMRVVGVQHGAALQAECSIRRSLKRLRRRRKLPFSTCLHSPDAGPEAALSRLVRAAGDLDEAVIEGRLCRSEFCQRWVFAR